MFSCAVCVCGDFIIRHIRQHVPHCKIISGATDFMKRKTLLTAWTFFLSMNDICTSQTVSQLRLMWNRVPTKHCCQSAQGPQPSAHMEVLRLRAITAQFTLATLYVAPLQHLINTTRNRESRFLAAEEPPLNRWKHGCRRCVGNMRRPPSS